MAKPDTVVGYDPETGNFYRDGEVAGCTESLGYKKLWFCGEAYRAHRLAWFFMNGEWPERIDHINRDKTDNRWCNLREATNQQNMVNTGLQSNNTSGHKGVSYDSARNKWQSYVTVDGKRTSLGRFDSLREASVWASVAHQEAFGEVA